MQGLSTQDFIKKAKASASTFRLGVFFLLFHSFPLSILKNIAKDGFNNWTFSMNKKQVMTSRWSGKTGERI